MSCLPLHYFQSVFSFVSLSQEITCLISETFSVWEFWAVSFYKNLCLQKYKFHNLSKANIRMFFLSSFRFWFLWLIILAENFKVPHFKNICLILDPNSPLLNNSSTFNNCSILKLAFALIPAKSNSSDYFVSKLQKRRQLFIFIIIIVIKTLNIQLRRPVIISLIFGTCEQGATYSTLR